MTEYIKKDDALECCPMLVDRFGYPLDTSVEYDMISELEPEDVAPVVRCRDCFANGLCSVQDVLFDNDLDKAEDFFCANGRREEDG